MAALMKWFERDRWGLYCQLDFFQQHSGCVRSLSALRLDSSVQGEGLAADPALVDRGATVSSVA